ASRRVGNAAPEVVGVVVGTEILPHDEVMRPRGDLERELADVHRLAIRRRQVLAALVITARRDDERLHAHLKTAMRASERKSLRVGDGAEREYGEHRGPMGAHSATAACS